MEHNYFSICLFIKPILWKLISPIKPVSEETSWFDSLWWKCPIFYHPHSHSLQPVPYLLLTCIWLGQVLWRAIHFPHQQLPFSSVSTLPSSNVPEWKISLEWKSQEDLTWSYLPKIEEFLQYRKNFSLLWQPANSTRGASRTCMPTFLYPCWELFSKLFKHY